MMSTKLFLSNRSQAVRIPKSLAFGDNIKEVSIIRQGNGLLIIPNENLWDDFFEEPGSPDFMSTGREQPDMQEREFFDD